MGWTTITNVAGMYPAFKRSPAWSANTLYYVGQTTRDTNGNVEKCTTAGTSGATQPTWSTALNSTTADNTVTWTNLGPLAAQQPTDALIQQYIDDVAGTILAVLQRRFAEVASASANFNAYLSTVGVPPAVGTDPTASPWNLGQGTQSVQLAVLERGNRYGAAYQLGATLASLGIAGARDLSRHYGDEDWARFIQELNAESANGKAKSFGAFDFLFDPQANVSSPRPGLVFIAGGDQQPGASPADENVGALFGKWGIDFGRTSAPLDPLGGGTGY